MKVNCRTCSLFSLKWSLIACAVFGVACTAIGTFIGASPKFGREGLNYGLLIIAVGVMVILVSACAWRLCTKGPAWGPFGVEEMPDIIDASGSTLELTGRRFLPRVPDPHGRSGAHHHPYGAMFYPEFQYRPPPPSYQASMQEYRLRLLLLERLSSHTQSTSLSPVSPPPTYRSSAASSLAGTLNRHGGNTLSRPISRPPSYRSIIDQNSVNNNSLNGHGNSVSCINIINNNNNSLGHQIYSSSLHTTSTSSNASQQSQGPITNGDNGTVTTISNHKDNDDVNRITIHQTNSTSTACTTDGINIVAIALTNENEEATDHTNSSTMILPNYSPSSMTSVAVTSNSNNLLTQAFNNGPNPTISNSRNSEVQILAHV